MELRPNGSAGVCAFDGNNRLERRQANMWLES